MDGNIADYNRVFGRFRKSQHLFLALLHDNIHASASTERQVPLCLMP